MQQSPYVLESIRKMQKARLLRLPAATFTTQKPMSQPSAAGGTGGKKTQVGDTTLTHKSLVNVLDSLVETICARKGFDTRLACKGGQREAANSLLHLALHSQREAILAAAGAPVPVADSEVA